MKNAKFIVDEKERELAIKKAIKSMKDSDYGVTAIKVELEAQLNRNSSHNASSIECQACDGTGDVWADDDNEEYIDCSACNGTGMAQTATPSVRHNWANDEYCKEWLDSHVSKEARGALIYGMFYRDGSVDSEYTFTMPIAHPEYCIEYIKAWKLMAQEIGGGNETTGAGMHIAVLNDSKGRYPTGNKLDTTKTANFKYAIDRLMPALFFLSSPDHKSRPLQYRMPSVGLGNSREDKYHAIATYSRVFEFRVFETCYDNPDAFYDMFCVVANSLKFYKSDRVELPFFGKIGKLGFKDGYGLDRFYYSAKHIEALESGVEELRPSYKTFEQLKKERGFRLDHKVLATKNRRHELQWEIAYKEYVAITEHGNKARIKRITEDYERMVQSEGESWVGKAYGSIEKYVEGYAQPSQITSLVEYVAKCKRAFEDEGVITTVTV